MTQYQLPQGTPLHDGEIAAAMEGTGRQQDFKTAKSTQTALNWVRSRCVCLFICIWYVHHNCTFHPNKKTWQESPDPPPLCTILEVICAGVGWVWEGDYMSITWHCTSGEESIATATVLNCVSQGSLVPGHIRKQPGNLCEFKLCTDVRKVNSKSEYWLVHMIWSSSCENTAFLLVQAAVCCRFYYLVEVKQKSFKKKTNLCWVPIY